MLKLDFVALYPVPRIHQIYLIAGYFKLQVEMCVIYIQLIDWWSSANFLSFMALEDKNHIW